MEQLLCHLLGDYITQTDWMANNKTKSMWPAMVHALVYSVPFWFFIPMSLVAWLVIFTTHFFIDRFRLARFVIFAKNWITNPKLKWQDCNLTGYPNSMPAWLSVWLMIISDNFMHLSVNYFSIKFL